MNISRRLDIFSIKTPTEIDCKYGRVSCGTYEIKLKSMYEHSETEIVKVGMTVRSSWVRDGQKKLYTGRDRRRKREGEREVVAEREREW